MWFDDFAHKSLHQSKIKKLCIIARIRYFYILNFFIRQSEELRLALERTRRSQQIAAEAESVRSQNALAFEEHQRQETERIHRAEGVTSYFSLYL